MTYYAPDEPRLILTVATHGAVERAVQAFETGGVCAPHGKCGGGCPSALFHRIKLALLAAELPMWDGD